MMEVTQLGFWDKPKRTIQYKQVGNVLMLGGGRQSSGLVEMSAGYSGMGSMPNRSLSPD